MSAANAASRKSGGKKNGKKRAGSESQFPGKLHDLMEYISNEGREDVVSWVDNGTAFVVINPEKLVDLLPRFFSQTKYRSFQRQLNMWHFVRILDGPHRGGWKHPYFIRAKRSLCRYMSRHLMKIPNKAFVVEHQTMNHQSQQHQHQHQHQTFGCASQQPQQSQQSQQPNHKLLGSCGFNAPAYPFSTVASLSSSSMSKLPYENIFESAETNDLLDAATLISQSPFEPTPIENMKPFSFGRNNILSHQDGDLMSFGGRNFHYVDINGGSSSNDDGQSNGQMAQQQQHSTRGYGATVSTSCVTQSTNNNTNGANAPRKSSIVNGIRIDLASGLPVINIPPRPSINDFNVDLDDDNHTSSTTASASSASSNAHTAAHSSLESELNVNSLGYASVTTPRGDHRRGPSDNIRLSLVEDNIALAFRQEVNTALQEQQCTYMNILRSGRDGSNDDEFPFQ